MQSSVFIQYLLVLASYLIGSIPFGLLIAKFLYKVDITKHGSGNVGATNVFRVCGKLPGMLTFLLDFYKAIIILIVLKEYFKTTMELELAICIAAILGHSYSIFLKFKGGKAVTSSFACILVIYPMVAASLAIFWLASFAIFQTVGIASIVASLLLLLSAIQVLVYLQHIPTFVFMVFVSVLIIYKHIPNIKLIRAKLKSDSKLSENSGI